MGPEALVVKNRVAEEHTPLIVNSLCLSVKEHPVLQSQHRHADGPSRANEPLTVRNKSLSAVAANESGHLHGLDAFRAGQGQAVFDRACIERSPATGLEGEQLLLDRKPSKSEGDPLRLLVMRLPTPA